MTRVGLTAAQHKLYAFVEGELNAGRPSPSFEEMATAMGLRSKSSIHRLVTGIVERGWLVSMPNRARTLAFPTETAPQPVQRREAVAPPAPAAAPTPDRRLSIPKATVAELLAYCDRHRLAPRDVLATAVALHVRGRI